MLLSAPSLLFSFLLFSSTLLVELVLLKKPLDTCKDQVLGSLYSRIRPCQEDASSFGLSLSGGRGGSGLGTCRNVSTKLHACAGRKTERHTERRGTDRFFKSFSFLRSFLPFFFSFFLSFFLSLQSAHAGHTSASTQTDRHTESRCQHTDRQTHRIQMPHSIRIRT